jgi:hypothetical protein
LFTATLFLANPNLGELPEVIPDIEIPREERAFCNYINSLGIKGVKVRNLYADLVDGLVLLKVLDRI